MQEDTGFSQERARTSSGFRWIFAGMLVVACALGLNAWAVWQQAVHGAVGPIVSNMQQKVEDREWLAFEMMYQYLREEYVVEPDVSVLMQGAMKGMIEALDDPRSHYYNPTQMKNQSEQSEGSYSGIGSTVLEKDGYVTLVQIYADSPAERAGLKSGDQLLEIDGVSAKGMSLDEAVSLVKGPSGTVVRLRILRAEEAEPFDVEVVRALVETQSVSGEMLEEGIGLITITSFTNTTGSQFGKELQRLLDAGMKGLVLDLRNNGGGTLEGLMDVANMLVPEGKVFSWTFRDRLPEDHFSSLKQRPFEVVVLINGYSASASEVLAGALQDSGSGKLIGVRSFGKGSAQYTYRLPNLGGVSLTVSKWVTPLGRHIEGQGLEPDIKVLDPVDPLVIEKDRPIKPGQIELLQAKLQALGYDAPFEEVSDTEAETPSYGFSEKTVQAIREFQQDNLIYVSGALSDDTLQVLNRRCYEEIPHLDDPQKDVALEEIRKMIAP